MSANLDAKPDRGQIGIRGVASGARPMAVSNFNLLPGTEVKRTDVFSERTLEGE